MTTAKWFALNNGATYKDAEFLESLGIKILERMGSTGYYQDARTGDMIGNVGTVFVFTDGRVRVRPTLDAGKGAVTMLLRVAVDCLERDLHKREGWEYLRKTPKRMGRWRSTIGLSVDPETLQARQILAMSPYFNRGFEEGRDVSPHELALEPETAEGGGAQ